MPTLNGISDKQIKIKKYLEKVSWAPINLIVSKFDISRHDLTTMLAEMLAEIDIRVESDIVHVTKF